MLQKLKSFFNQPAEPLVRSGHAPIGSPFARIDLIALDIDGVLLQPNNLLNDQVATAVQEAMAQGVRIVPVTARPPFDVYSIYQQLGLSGHMINFNGSLICEPSKSVLYHLPIPLETAQQIIELTRKISAQAQLRIDVVDRWYTDRTQSTKANPRLQPPSKVGPIAEILKKPPTRLTFLAPAYEIASARKEIASRFGHQVSMPFVDERVLQVSHVNTEKAIALQRLGQRHVMAIGDAPNDIEMLRWAGCGVAAGNVWAGASDVADVMVSSDIERGVREAIRKYVLSS